MPDTKRIIARIYVEGRRCGTAWVPYKTLIGYGIGNRVIIGSQGEQVHTSQEFGSQQAAVDAAKATASEIIQAKFGEAGAIQWIVLAEGIPVVMRRSIDAPAPEISSKR